eukprot:NODE_2232_length_2261_cov_18.275070.p1 GENE.NODE_2232_length_2261_cov_18.275070~~NODE_2232_length_2261_cov_18.275070.p1  ORF type:complete len:561 (+),score=129.99 NODE_2232_length_2261_cov_18.275070:277-1959(+)
MMPTKKKGSVQTNGPQPCRSGRQHDAMARKSTGEFTSRRDDRVSTISGAPNLQQPKSLVDAAAWQVCYQRHLMAAQEDRKRAYRFGRDNLQLRAQAIVNHRYFDNATNCAIALNTFVIGWQTEWQMDNVGVEKSAAYVFSNEIFTAIFTAELIMRIVADGRYFCSISSASFGWNCADLVIVISALTETLMSLAGTRKAVDLSLLRMLRILRSLRVLRIVRALQFFSDLRAMVAGIASSSKSLCWAILILAALMYLYSTVIMQLLAFSLDSGLEESQISFVHTYFGSIGSSMSVLAQCVTGGKDWGEISDALRGINMFYDVIFTSYIVFAVLGVLNIVTGIFVDSATRNVQKDADQMIMHEMSNRQGWLMELAKVFEGVDVDKEGHITLEDFKHYILSEQVQAYLRSHGLDVNTNNAAALFTTIDFDDDGYLTMEQFVDGCARVAGTARQLDLARVASQLKAMGLEVMRLRALVRPQSEPCSDEPCSDDHVGEEEFEEEVNVEQGCENESDVIPQLPPPCPSVMDEVEEVESSSKEGIGLEQTHMQKWESAQSTLREEELV